MEVIRLDSDTIQLKAHSDSDHKILASLERAAGAALAGDKITIVVTGHGYKDTFTWHPLIKGT